MGRVMDIPEPLTLISDNQDGTENREEVTFQKFLQVAIDSYDVKDKTLEMLRQQDKVIQIIQDAKGTLAFEDADYDLAFSSAKERVVKLPTVLGRQCLCYVDVLKNAEKVTIGKDK